jgi:hypothetical protein
MGSGRSGGWRPYTYPSFTARASSSSATRCASADVLEGRLWQWDYIISRNICFDLLLIQLRVIESDLPACIITSMLKTFQDSAF